MSACGPFLLVGFILTPRLWRRLRLVTETGPRLACVALPIAVAFHRLFTVVPKCRNVPSVSEHAVFYGCTLSLCLRVSSSFRLQLVIHAEQHFRRVHRRKLQNLKTLLTVNYNKPCFLISVQYYLA